VNEAQSSTFTLALRVVGGGLDQMSGLGFPAAEDGKGHGPVGRDAAPGRLGYRLGLRHQQAGLGEIPGEQVHSRVCANGDGERSKRASVTGERDLAALGACS
jgi:hypothetical protein